MFHIKNNKFNRLLYFATEQSLSSTVKYKHGAVIFQGRKPICFGYNSNKRTKYLKNLCCSIHAEMDVLSKFLNSFIKIHNTKSNPHKTRRKLKKYSICVVRSIERCDGSIELQDSYPCLDCLIKLKMVGLNKITYSTGLIDEHLTNKINRISNNTSNYSQVMTQKHVLEHMRVVHLLS